MAKKWYVLHTYSGYENKVKKNLQQRIESMGLENKIFRIEIPTETVTEIKEGGKRVESEKKVLPGYVLVRMELDPQSWAAVRNTPGVTGFVGSEKHPIPLTDAEAQRILKSTDETKLKPEIEFEVGDVVRINSGVFENYTGTITSIDTEKCRLKVLVEETPIELDYKQVDEI